MSDPVVFSTFYNPNFPGVLIIDESVLQTLIDLLEIEGHQVTWNNNLSPDYQEE